ncbi:MAG: HAMP domain-containing histidine kinase [Bacteroidetes bacterium]|nr:MAG: HAMP domain-containing histidine kinase [Bacteroidota bacterium]
MNIDQILLFFALLNFIMGMVYLIYFWTGTRTNLFLITFFVGKVCQGFGLFFMSTQVGLTWLQGPWLGACLGTIGLTLEVFTFISYDQIFKRKQAIFLFGLALLGVLAVLLNYRAEDRIVIFCFNLPLGFVFLYGAYILSQKPRLSRFAQVSLGSFTLFGLSWLFAAAHALWTVEGFDMHSLENPARVILNFVSLVNFTIVSLGYIMLLKEQDEWKLKEAAKIIEQDNLKLQELNSTKNQFFSIIAHDLRGPLGSMSQIGEMLNSQEEQFSSSERSAMLQALAGSLKNSFVLLENLLLWARSESGLIQVEKSDVSLAEIMQQNLRLLAPTITQKTIQVQMNIPENLRVFSDESMLSTVFRNLLSNAVKFVRQGGLIQIECEHAGDRLLVHIQDNGIGIPKEKLSTLFDLNSRYSSLGTRKESGSGLGLKLCKQFTDQLGVDLKVESSPGHGSTFSLLLPNSKQ